MRCHQCNQDNIKIKEGHIYCDICGLDINCPQMAYALVDLFIYNENLEAAEKLGRETYGDDKKLSDNPYSLNSDQIIMHKKWEEGWKSEKECYEKEGLSLSSEKLKAELDNMIDDRNEKVETMMKYYNNYTKLKQMILKLSDQGYILGRTYRQDISIIVKYLKSPDS